MANHEAASSDFIYDVFLSFRGETRYTFTDHLYDALRRNGINTFRDDEELRTGEEIRPAILQAIEKSRILIIVLSENYASSTWCLDELVKIIECKEKQKKQLVLPIFYKVEPSNVRKQTGSFAEAMLEHENRFGKDSAKVKAWGLALSGVCDIKGEHCGNDISESEFIKKIVKETSTKLPPVPLQIKPLVGLDYHFEEVKSLIDIDTNDTVCMLGIYGAGGIGKTTFAVDLYNKLRHQFEAASFLGNIREKSNKSINGLVDLQKTLLSEMGEETGSMMGSTFKGASVIKGRLGSKRVLLVLDDVDKEEQLESLAGGSDWFGHGSRIIITTRDASVLHKHEFKIKKYKMKELNDRDSLELFCWHAFDMSGPEENFTRISNRAVSYAKGIPLALRVIGSNLKGGTVEEWEIELEKYRKAPDGEIQVVLEISYNSLSDLQQKIFLDIACFFKGERWEYVKMILEACDFYPVIRVFVNKCLITVDENGCLEMHDLIQDMGREIVRKESPSNVGARSRLWSHKEVLQVFKENSGSSRIEGIMLDPPQREEVDCWNRTAFKKMRSLRILIIRRTWFLAGPTHLPNQLRLLDWEQYPLDSFPPGFYPERIVDFNLPHSCLILEKPFQKFEDLTFINISDCPSITQIPDVSQAKRLRKLTLDRCKKLVGFDKSVGFMPNLVYLSAWECTALKSFVPKMYLPSLEMLSFNFCSRLEHFPDVVQKMDKPLKIHMIGTAIQQFPDSIGNLTGLEYIDMSFCKGLRDLPRNFFLLPKLVMLKISGCSQLGESFRRFKESHSMANGCPNLKTLYFKNANLLDEHLHVILEHFPKLEDLRVSRNDFISLPESIKRTFCLRSLDVSYCKNLKEIPELSPSIQKVEASHCWSLTSEASIALWSKISKENDRFEVVMPKMEIPQWFDRVCKEDIPLFWARRKFPVVALAFVFENFNEMSIVGLFSKLSSEVNWQPVGLHLFIDGKEIFGKDYHYFRVGEEHVLLCDLRVLFNDEEWQGLDACLGDDWKAVQVDCKSDLILSQWGVYVYKQETNMEDIKFSLPNPNSSRDSMPSLLVLRTPERIIKHAREIFSLIFDEILNVIMPVEEIDTQALILLSIIKEDEASAITYGASLKQQHQGSIREIQRSLQTLKWKQLIEALFSNPEVVSIFTRRVEEKTMAEASAVANGASLEQLFLQALKPCKIWKEMIEIAASFPEVEKLLMELGEELRWTTKSDEASAADNGTKLKQQEEASSSQMQGLHVKEFIEEFASVPEISEVFASLPGLKYTCSQFCEEIAQHGLQLLESNMDLSMKESDDEKHAETPYNPPNQNLGETRGVVANNPTAVPLLLFYFFRFYFV